MHNYLKKENINASPGDSQTGTGPDLKHLKLPETAGAGASKLNRLHINIMDILDALPFYAMLIDAHHYILDANQAVQTVLGVNRSDILGQYCPQVIHGLKTPFPGCPLEESAEKNIAVEKELFDEKNQRWVVSAVYPTRAFTDDGRQIFLHMVTDVTDRKQAQEQLQTSREQLRKLTAHCESVREEEKRKIARDLHDGTSQVLASLYAHLEAAVKTLPPNSRQTEELLRKAQALSTGMLDDVHKLIYELRPSVLDELGLFAAVNSMVNNYLKVTRLKVDIRTRGNTRRLAYPVEIALFRVIQEALNNIIKHAQARKAVITLWFKARSINIRIKDDGVGFDIKKVMSSVERYHAYGLLGMKERIELLNGSFTVNSSPGQGTEVIIEVPLESVRHG